MKLAVSSIAWTNEEETEVAELLQSLGVKYVEIAPTKLWADPTKATNQEIDAQKKFWNSYGIEIVAFQSMLFTRPDLKLFESAENRLEATEYMQGFVELAGKMGAKVMVFGSPKNRQKGDLDEEESYRQAAEFFIAVGDTAQANDVAFCIEPNPTDYACDFITNSKDGIEFVKYVSNAGFGLHLDIAGMTLAKDNITESIHNSSDILKHFHISSPYLEQVEERKDVDHQTAAEALKAINYDNFVSIEMKPADRGLNVARVEKAVRFAQKVYI